MGLVLGLELERASQSVRELGLESGSVKAMVPEYASALALVLGLGLEPASQLVRELELASGLVLALALVMAFLERLASGSVGRVERVRSQQYCSAC